MSHCTKRVQPPGMTSTNDWINICFRSAAAPAWGARSPLCIHAAWRSSLRTHFCSARAPNQALIGMLVFDPARGDPGLINSMTLRKNPIASSIFAEHEQLFDSVCRCFARPTELLLALYMNNGRVVHFQRRAFGLCPHVLV